MAHIHAERHLSERAGWLRAAVLGADDGLVSTAGLMIGVSAAAASRGAILVAGLAGLVAGAMSMAAGEYVSVSSQRDAQRADVARESAELATDPEGELHELAGIYRARGLDPALADEVARALSRTDPLAAHLRDELGVTPDSQARPVQAAVVSAVSFSVGAAVPFLAVAVTTAALRTVTLTAATLLALGALGALGAQLGGARRWRGAARVLAGGVLALLVSAAIGHLAGGIVR